MSRITPTYMGNTVRHRVHGLSDKDHPHIHGEYYANVGLYSMKSGSPPHTWGIRFLQALDQSQWRITPTYMGNTIPAPPFRRVLGDHPHIHGEYSKQIPI